MKSLDQCHLYGILDLGYAARQDLRETCQLMVDHGVDILQLRAKEHELEEIEKMAFEIHPITQAAKIPLVINDHPSIAARVGAEGIHVGQDDLPIDEVRKLVPRDCFVGRSTHSLAQAEQAQSEGADYIGFGPIFSTPTKPTYQAIGLEDITEVHRRVQIPIFCIGGLKKENLGKIVERGANRAVIVSGILQASDIGAYTREAADLLTS